MICSWDLLVDSETHRSGKYLPMNGLLLQQQLHDSYMCFYSTWESYFPRWILFMSKHDHVPPRWKSEQSVAHKLLTKCSCKKTYAPTVMPSFSLVQIHVIHLYWQKNPYSWCGEIIWKYHIFKQVFNHCDASFLSIHINHDSPKSKFGPSLHQTASLSSVARSKRPDVEPGDLRKSAGFLDPKYPQTKWNRGNAETNSLESNPPPAMSRALSFQLPQFLQQKTGIQNGSSQRFSCLT